MSDSGAVGDRVLTIPNALSVLRLVLVPVFGWAIVDGHDGWALAILMISGFTDYLDGKLARSWGQVSRVGQLLDPAADRLYIVAALVGLAARDVVPWWLVGLLVARDLLLTLTLPLLARHGYGPLPVHFLGKAATFNLLYAFPVLLLAELVPDGAAPYVRAAAWAFVWWGTALYWWAALLYLRQALSIIRAVPSGPGPGEAQGTPGD